MLHLQQRDSLLCLHLQVELNTIASSFGCLSTLTTQLHKHVLGRLAAAAAATAGPNPTQQQQQDMLQLLDHQRLPSNEAMAGISRALAAATRAAGGPNAVMVMVVQPGERNAYDQQWLQQTLWQEHGVATQRLSLGEMQDAMELRPHPQQQQQQQQLVLKSTGQVVGCVYFRAGYTPNDYPSEKEWQVGGMGLGHVI
jgi:glutathione synthase